MLNIASGIADIGGVAGLVKGLGKGIGKGILKAGAKELGGELAEKGVKAAAKGYGDNMAKAAAAMLGRAAKGGGDDALKAAAKAAKGGADDVATAAAAAAARVAKKTSFKNFRALKRAYPNSPGKVWHHVVEQSQAKRFGDEAIQCIRNTVEVTPAQNHLLNKLYSALRPEITGSSKLTVRQWMKTKSFKQASEFGRIAVEKVTQGIWP